MKALEFLSIIPPVRRDNFNRKSSFCASKSGFVIHSGIHRSTAFISRDAHSDGYFAFQYWSRQGQDAINGFVESTIDGLELEACEAEAFRRSRPGWSVRRCKGTGTSLGAGELIASNGDKLPTIHAAFTYRHLHSRTAKP